MKLSARDELWGVVTKINVEAMHELGLAEGSAVTAIVKASDVILAVDDQGGYVGPSVAQRAAREGGVPRRAHALIRGALPA